jgi:hypothetical protein
MANLPSRDLIKPVPPGISFTDIPRTTPWNTPPKMVKVSDIAQKYVDGLSSPETLNSTLGSIETGVPLAALANAIMLTGVGSNGHTIDAGILVLPVIIEMLVTLAEIHGVEYTVFPKDPNEDVIPDRVVRNAMKKAAEPLDKKEVQAAPEIKLSGLMARKPNKMENM